MNDQEYRRGERESLMSPPSSLVNDPQPEDLLVCCSLRPGHKAKEPKVLNNGKDAGEGKDGGKHEGRDDGKESETLREWPSSSHGYLFISSGKGRREGSARESVGKSRLRRTRRRRRRRRALGTEEEIPRKTVLSSFARRQKRSLKYGYASSSSSSCSSGRRRDDESPPGALSSDGSDKTNFEEDRVSCLCHSSASSSSSSPLSSGTAASCPSRKIGLKPTVDLVRLKTTRDEKYPKTPSNEAGRPGENVPKRRGEYTKCENVPNRRGKYTKCDSFKRFLLFFGAFGGGGGGGRHLGVVLAMVALMVSSCQGLPTQSTQEYTNPDTDLNPQSPTKRDWTLCCGGGDAEGSNEEDAPGETNSPKLAVFKQGNVTVTRTSPTSVCVTWTRHAPLGQRHKHEVTYKPINAKYRVVAEVVSPHRSLVLERLLPLTQYQLQVTTFVNKTILWRSSVVTFHTTRDDSLPDNGTAIIFSTPAVLGAEVSVVGPKGSSSSPIHQEGFVRVRAEEVGIVLLVLAVWMFAIALFFNRWGKIRMLEPYQEPYKEAPPQLLQHRPSCPMAGDPCTLPINPLKFEHNGSRRPRQNSVFVGRTRSHSLEGHPPRRVKSALNLTTLVLQESEEEAGIATTFT